MRGVTVIPHLARTWDEVPGAYTQGVLVAGAGKHGSRRVLFHEWGHAVGDLLKHNQDGDLIVAFLRLRSELDPFFARLEPMKGARELFAEGMASYFGAGKQEAINEFDAEFVQYIEKVIQKEQAHD